MALPNGWGFSGARPPKVGRAAFSSMLDAEPEKLAARHCKPLLGLSAKAVVVIKMPLVDRVSGLSVERSKTERNGAVITLSMVVGAENQDVVFCIRAVVGLAQRTNVVPFGVCPTRSKFDGHATDLAAVLVSHL